VCFDLLGATGGQVGWGVLVIVIGAIAVMAFVVYLTAITIATTQS
jgi:hydrogenase-4 component B